MYNPFLEPSIIFFPYIFLSSPYMLVLKPGAVPFLNDAIHSTISLIGRWMESYENNIPSASSYALPAPNPSPTQAGHALRLKRRTENTIPNERPREERIRKEEMVRSH